MALYVVATPIGNLDDLSVRARQVLEKAAAVACEDTRHTLGLLTHAGIRRPLLRYDDHVHARETPRLLERLRRGEDIALVTDAGTPGVSDPGGRLIAEAVKAGIPVVPVPGPSAALAALVGSGLPMDAFTFLGFPPRRPGRMKKCFQSAGDERTLVLYESPFRLKGTLECARGVFGDIPACVARELTKIHEEFIRGSIGEVTAVLSARGPVKGEVAVVLAPQLKAAISTQRSAVS
jgi:16S rRNA (cytidine1402-2'-O)-methyltransferase